MELQEAKQHVLDICHDWGIDDVRFSTRMTRAIGSCRFFIGEFDYLVFSTRFLREYDRDTITNVVMHEIGHAMLPYHAKHGPEWQQVMRELGYPHESTHLNKKR